MDYQALLTELEQLVRETAELWDPGWVTFNWRRYTFDHVQRVRGLALTLCEREGGDLGVVELAALLHDITKPYDGEYQVDEQGKRAVDENGYWRNRLRPPQRTNAVTALYDGLGLAGQLHNDSGAVIAEHLLAARGVNAETVARVAQTIRDHLRVSNDAPVESRCLYDADTIDANIGLPAFVRNIYINLHFFDQRKPPDTPPIATLLRDEPLGFLGPYVGENLPRWVAGKRQDFIPRLTTAAGRELAAIRLRRLEGTFSCLASELDTFSPNGHRQCLDIVTHYMYNRDDPSIAEETARLAERWLSDEVSPDAKELLKRLRREMAGVE
ncbi:MAG: HD domain-containing protein [Anaerolineae bacterium]|nr:HD domain-containing protein [Anaerolineae bacterium]